MESMRVFENIGAKPMTALSLRQERLLQDFCKEHNLMLDIREDIVTVSCRTPLKRVAKVDIKKKGSRFQLSAPPLYKFTKRNTKGYPFSEVLKRIEEAIVSY